MNLDDLKSMDILDVASRLGLTVWRRGSNYMARCPWHDDKHPSLLIGGKLNRCKCMACGEGGSTIDLVMQVEGLDFLGACEWLDPLNFSRHEIKAPLCSGRPEVQEEAVEMTVFDYEIALSYVSVDNSFSRCLAHVFGEEIAERVTREYLLGLYDEQGYDDDVLFPSIDAEGRLRDMKIQHYETDPQSPDFFHCDKRHILWWAGLLQRSGRLSQSAVVNRNCLFGEHLLTRYPSRQVALVESPKNALLGSASDPTLVWVATGNKTSLRRQVLRPLQGRDVLVYPDNDAWDDWSAILRDNQDIAHFLVSDTVRQWGGEKSDIGDLILIHNS